MPCDTIYGILGLCPNTQEKITKLKGRREEKPYIRFIESTEVLTRMSHDLLDQEILDMLPGPLTLIIRNHELHSVGVRVPADDRLLGLLKETAKPLFTTSVNRSGQAPLWRIQDIIDTFRDDVDLIIDGGDLPGGIPSTILDVTVRPYKILRQGACIIPNRLLKD